MSSLLEKCLRKKVKGYGRITIKTKDVPLRFQINNKSNRLRENNDFLSTPYNDGRLTPLAYPWNGKHSVKTNNYAYQERESSGSEPSVPRNRKNNDNGMRGKPNMCLVFEKDLTSPKRSSSYDDNMDH